MKRLNLVGHVFERLTVLEELGKLETKHVHWRCVCVCGQEAITTTLLLRTGKKKSCGCLRKETAAQHCLNMEKHGHYKKDRPTSEWSAWASMRARCYSTSCRNYKRYGAKGITVCNRWLESFENFLADMGPKPTAKHSLDRIDNSGNYSPENCRWATSKQQNNNSSFNSNITAAGETKTKAQWCEELGISRGRLRRALERTSDPAAALLDAVERTEAAGG